MAVSTSQPQIDKMHYKRSKEYDQYNLNNQSYDI